MKKIIIVLSLLSLAACTKKSSTSSTTTTPSSSGNNTFTLTFKGKTFTSTSNFILNSGGLITSETPTGHHSQVTAGTTSSSGSITSICEVISGVAGSFSCSFLASASGRNSTLGIDTVQVLVDPTYFFTDISDGNLQYGIDSGSTVTVTQADGDWASGTMNFNLVSGGVHYPATGSFKITLHT